MARYGERKSVYVVPFAGSGIKYGFNSGISEGNQTELGQIPVDLSALQLGLVFGANAPKPGRASKLLSSGNESSYYDISQAGALSANGWRLTSPTIRRGRASRKSKCVYITLDGINYAWMQNNETNTAIAADLGTLGINVGTANDRDLVWGVRSPKPPRASKTGADNRTISTFIDPLKADNLPAGWAMTGKEKVTD